MKSVELEKFQAVFKRWGRMGGKKRAKQLTATRRSEIAKLAAKVRWMKPDASSDLSVRLNESNFDDPVFLEEVLSDGNLVEWKKLYDRLSEFPFGKTADALDRLLAHHYVYGSSLLWQAILESLQGGYVNVQKNKVKIIP